MKTIVKGISNIRENAQTITYPTSAEVANHIKYTKGWVTAIYSYHTNSWMFGYHETRDEAIAYWDELKHLVELVPDSFGSWLEYSEMVVYGSYAEFNPKWSVHFVIVED